MANLFKKGLSASRAMSASRSGSEAVTGVNINSTKPGTGQPKPATRRKATVVGSIRTPLGGNR
jgi:hypothetical protein